MLDVPLLIGGLSAAIFSRDTARALAQRVESGGVGDLPHQRPDRTR